MVFPKTQSSAYPWCEEEGCDWDGAQKVEGELTGDIGEMLPVRDRYYYFIIKGTEA